ncbi:hypothetical protein O4H49_00005 [Kiloniella laminariae]|uniref:Uncharacterized protein n=1 Tax=Kiloniella laminariae TaxID=454162 RepID=A0ABT4LDZ0_9PROT|nr:hypothetical protein [Kiloniella laminariae]MCZ4279135.1 hypothetical protein [Kiloniella laminariae]
MKLVLVEKKILSSCVFETFECNGEFLHRVELTGNTGRQERIPLYQETLALNKSKNYFCILDNRRGFENTLTLDDIRYFDDMLVCAGIECFYGATVTLDNEYKKITTLANFNVEVSKLTGELLATSSYQEAEDFIFSQMKTRYS